MLIFHGDSDGVVPISQSRYLHERYEQMGLESSLHEIPGAGHGGMQFSDDTRYAQIKAFLDRRIKGRKLED